MAPIVHVHADESCLGVQFTDRDSPGGASGLIEVWRSGACNRRDLWIAEPATTNNRMALRGAIEILAHLRGRQRVIFYSDSTYLVDGWRKWAPNWARRGWRRKSGAVENVDLWKQLASVARRHEVDPRWDRGHAGNPRNEYADHLATRAAKKQTSSAGFVGSEFEDWLEVQRDRYGRYFDFLEFEEPPTEGFDPAPAIPD